MSKKTAVELIKAKDLIRELSQAGKAPTQVDLNRLNDATQKWDAGK